MSMPGGLDSSGLVEPSRLLIRGLDPSLGTDLMDMTEELTTLELARGAGEFSGGSEM